MADSKQEAKRLYSCVMHDFHDGVDRQEMWEKEIQLVINQQVCKALEEAKSNSESLWTVDGKEVLLAVPVSDIDDVITRYE